MRECRERADHRQLAHVAFAEIGLEPPDRHQDLARHAELLLDSRKQRGIPLQHRPPAIDAAGADASRDILLEGLVEGVALAAVEGEHAAILRHAAERGGDHALRDAGRGRLRRDARDERVEITAAARGEGGSRRGQCAQKNDQMKFAHLCLSLWPPWPIMPRANRVRQRCRLNAARG
jgi:hypothetical protein